MELQSDRSKKDIADALISLMRKKDFNKITNKDITNRAGLSHITIYRNFNNKDEIVKYVRAEKKINERKFYLLSKDNGKTAYFKAVVYKNNEKHVVFVSVSEKFLKIEGYEEPEVSWEDFYTKRHIESQGKTI